MSLFKKVVGTFVELDESQDAPHTSATTTTTATPTTPSLPPAVVPGVVVSSEGALNGEVTSEDIKAARDAVLAAVRYAEKTNLLKHTTTVAKLRSHMPNEDAAITAAFDTLDIVGVTKVSIVTEANACIAAAEAHVAGVVKDTVSFIDNLVAKKTLTINDLNREAADIQKQIQALQSRAAAVASTLASLDAETDAKRQAALAQRDLITATATELRSAWSKVTNAK